MKKRFLSGFSALVVMAAISTPAFADISAQEARDALIGYYESFGSQVAIGSEDNSGSSITLNDIKITTDLPKGGTIDYSFGPIGFQETGDGSVSIQLPAAMQTTINVAPDGKPPISTVLKMSLPGFTSLVSGAPDDIRIQSSGEGATFSINSLSVAGTEFPMSIIVQEGAFSSDYTVAKSADGKRNISGSASAQSVELLADAKEPGGSGFFNLKASLRDIAVTFAANMADTTDPLAILAQGFSLSEDLTAGSSAIDVSFQAKGKSFASKTSSSGSRFAFGISPDALTFDLSGNAVTVHVTSSDLPVPAVDLAYDSADISLAVPLSHAAQPRDFHLLTALRGLTVSEALWSIIDPGQSLSRDPATVALDVSGKVTVLTDLMDPAALASIGKSGVPPMLPVSLDINELTASVAGAEMNGTGSFAFDFKNPKTLKGIPLPAGELNLSLKGGYGLLDKLAAMGLVPENAATGIRAMLGVFAKPVGDDSFESKVEITTEGAILANGQRIK